MTDAIQHALYTKPTNRNRIALWVEAFLDFKIHSTIRCNTLDCQHTSQLDYISEGFFHIYSSCVFMASRNAGKSYAAAVLNILDCWFKPGIKIAVAAFQRNQSDYIYAYMVAFLEVFHQKIGQKIATIGKDEISFKNGSSVKFFSGGKSSAGIKGYHPNILQIDECDLFSLEQFDGIANALEAGGKFQRRLDVLSTNYSVAGDGVVLKQIERYEEFNRTKNPHLLPCRIYKVCLIDILTRCDDRFQCFDESTNTHCPLWKYCKGAAKEGNGFYKIESAFETMRDSSRQTFESQMLLLRPSSEFAYFHNFDSSKNICDPNRALDPTMLTFCIWDFGGVHCPHACLIMQKSPDGVYYVVDEFLAMGNLEGLIAKVKSRYPNATDFDSFHDPKGNDTLQVKDARSFQTTLKQNGFFSRARNLKRTRTAQMVFELIDPADGKPRLKVNKCCVNLLKQIYAAECETTRGGKPTTEIDDNGRDDLLDCLRYCIGWTGGTYAKHNGTRRLRWF